jgi:hypothetical protein
MLEQRLGPAEDGKQILVLNDAVLGDELIDEALALVANSKDAHHMQHWLLQFTALPILLSRAASSLVARGIVSEEKSRILWIIPSTRYPELNPEPERLLIERMERAIFGEPTELDARTVIAISLADKTGLLQLVFDKADLDRRREHIDAIIAGEHLAQISQEAIQSLVTALAASAIFVPILFPVIIN